MNLTSRYSEINKENIYLSLWDMKKPFIFAVPFRKVVARKVWNGEQKRSSLTGWTRAHDLDLRKIEMMKLGKKSEAFPDGWRG